MWKTNVIQKVNWQNTTIGIFLMVFFVSCVISFGFLIALAALSGLTALMLNVNQIFEIMLARLQNEDEK